MTRPPSAELEPSNYEAVAEFLILLVVAALSGAGCYTYCAWGTQPGPVLLVFAWNFTVSLGVGLTLPLGMAATYFTSETSRRFARWFVAPWRKAR